MSNWPKPDEEFWRKVLQDYFMECLINLYLTSPKSNNLAVAYVEALFEQLEADDHD